MINKDELKDLLKKNLNVKLEHKDNIISLVDNPMFRVTQNIISVKIEYETTISQNNIYNIYGALVVNS